VSFTNIQEEGRVWKHMFKQIFTEVDCFSSLEEQFKNQTFSLFRISLML